MIQEFGSKRSKMNWHCVMLSRQNSLFDWNQTFRANLASPESYAQENLTQLIQEFGSKTLENEFALRHAVETEFSFWLESNLQSSNLASPECYALENLTQRFKNLLQKRSKMNLHCVMLSRHNSLFDWN